MSSLTRGREIAVDRTRDRDSKERAEDVQGKPHVVYGSIEVAGVGEATIDIPFPVKYISKPAFLFGGQLIHGERLEGFMPTVNGVVIAWVEEEMPQSTEVDKHALYSGATIGIVTTGTQGQKFTLDYAFEGIALTNPVSPHHDGMDEV